MVDFCNWPVIEYHPLQVRVYFNGRIPAFQAGYVGSIPITRSTFIMRL